MSVTPMRNDTRLRVLAFLREYIADHGFPPSVREICVGASLASPSTAHAHLANLELDGLIVRVPGKSRALRVLA